MVFLTIIEKHIVFFAKFYISLRGKIFFMTNQSEKYSIILL